MRDGQMEREAEIDLLRGLPAEAPGRRTIAALIGSAISHLLLLTLAVRLPSLVSVQTEPERQVAVHKTPLYFPPSLLTQRAPNRAPVSKSIDLPSLLTPPGQETKRASGQPAQKRAEKPRTSAKSTPAPAPRPEPPQIAQARKPPPSPPQPRIAPQATPPPPTNTPKETPFQNLEDAPANPNPPLRPRNDVQSAIQGLAQQRANGNVAVSDENETSPATPGTPGNTGANASPHAAVELQSDPQGADFRAYLQQVLTIVRTNWRRVIPESVRMGTLRGRTTMEFIIDRSGKIPKIVVANSSGSDPLDRAAGAGLSMSDPLPPLPTDYRGFEVRLQFTFSYNMPTK